MIDGTPRILPPEVVSQLGKPVIPGEQDYDERDPWFDRLFDELTVLSKVEGLTTLSEVEGESRKLAENRILLEPPPKEAVSQFVIPAKTREAGREPGSKSIWNCFVFLDSGSHDA